LRLTSEWLQRAERFTFPLTVATGLLLGVAVTLTSVGAGALGVVALLALYPLRLTGDRLVATDIAHAVPVTAVAGASHALLGHVDPHVLGLLLAALFWGSVGIPRDRAVTGTTANALVAIMLAFVSLRMFANR